MTPERKAELFEAIRQIKGKGLTQPEVDLVNAILDRPEGQAPAPAPAPAPSDGRVPSAKAIDLIHGFETLELNAYRDPGSRNGLPITIGWGTTVGENGEPIRLGEVWTKEKADRLFARDLAKFSQKVSALLGNAPTTQNQFDALVSFAYNVGHGDGGLKTSTLLRMHKAGDYAGAQAQFARWNKNDGKVLNGLTRRRAAEAELYGS